MKKYYVCAIKDGNYEIIDTVNTQKQAYKNMLEYKHCDILNHRKTDYIILTDNDYRNGKLI